MFSHLPHSQSQILLPSPLLTPSSECRRSDALSKIEATLESKLTQERMALETAIAASQSASGSNNSHQEQIDLSEEMIDALESKIRRTRYTLASLQHAQTDLKLSAGKVSAAQQAIQQHQSSPKPDFQSSLRNELHEATGMMSTAARRVEQMESITDLLLEQLATKEGEIIHLQAEMATLTHQHTALVDKLETERGTLIDRLEAAAGLTVEYEHQQCELQAKLQQSLAQVASKSKQSQQLEVALKEEKDKLSKDLIELNQSQEMLREEVKAKEAELAAALEAAKYGTPKGEGAKKVLPMAFQRIKDTQQALQGEKEEAEFAKREAEMARKELKEVSTHIAQHLAALEAEGQRAVAEKQASLESMTRAAAAAAREAAVQAEAVLALKNDLDALSAERANLEDQLSNFNDMHGALVAELDHVNATLQSSEAENGSLAAALSGVELQLEEATATQQALKHDLALKEQAITAGETEIAELKVTLYSLTAQNDKTKNDHCNAYQEMIEAYTATIEKLEMEVCEISSERDVVTRQMDRRDMIIDEFQAAVDTTNAALEEAKAASAQAADQAESKIRSLEADICMLQQEKDAREAEEERLRAELDKLASELQVKDSEIIQARGVGTPVGESAKQVLKLSFKKIQAMHQQMAEHAQTIATCDQTIAELRSALKERQAATESVQSRLDAATNEASKAIEKLNQDMSRALQSVEEHKATAEAAQKDVAAVKENNARLLQELAVNATSLKAAQQAESQAAGCVVDLQQKLKDTESRAMQAEKSAQLHASEFDTISKLHTKLQAELTACQADLKDRQSMVASLTQQLQKAQQEASADSTALSSQLKAAQQQLEATATALSLKKEAMNALQSELDSLKASGTPQGNAAKEVVQLSFQKIRGLQETIEHQAETIQDLENRIDCAEDNASQLANQLLEEKAVLREVEKQYIEAAEHVAKVEKEIGMAKKEAAAAVVRAEQAAQAVVQAEQKAQQQKAAASEDLQAVLDKANDELDVATIEAKQAVHRAAALEEELANTQQLLTEAQSAIYSLNQLEQTVEAQTRMVERLRIDVQLEIAAKQRAQEFGQVLKLRVMELELEISSLQDTITHLGQTVATADQSFKAAEYAQERTEAEWLDALAAAGREREEAMAARSALEARISLMESQLSEAKAEIEAAKAAPTPKGEAAKTVSRLAMMRVKELQDALGEREKAAKQAEDRAAAVTGELERAAVKLAALQETAAEKAAQAEMLAAEAKQKNVELEQLKALAEQGDKAKQKADQLQLALATAKKEGADLAALKAASTVGLTKDMSVLQTRITRLEAQLHEANHEKAAFEARAVEAQSALDEIEHLQQVQTALHIAEAVSTEASAKASSAMEQRDELAARCAQLDAELDRSRKQMAEQGALLRRVSEALSLQRETNAAARELAATKEKELVRLLGRSETQVGKLNAELTVIRKKSESLARLEIEKEALFAKLQQVEARTRAVEASFKTESTEHSTAMRQQRNALKVSREECFTLRMQLTETLGKLAKLNDKESRDKRKKKGGGHPIPEAIIAIALVLVGSIFWRTSTSSSNSSK